MNGGIGESVLILAYKGPSNLIFHNRADKWLLLVSGSAKYSECFCEGDFG